ncbi:MAG: DJ-1/PfpI family protein [Anaerolineae bacterium]|nr:DJ-1/PfpI family protein [Anaerolineae bacterium]
MIRTARVLVLVADGFREMAVLPCVTSLRNAGVETLLVGLKADVRGAHGIAVTADTLLGELPPEPEETLVVIPGGLRCTRALLTDPRVHQLLEETLDHGGDVAVLAGAERLVDETVAGAESFRHQGKLGLEAFLQACVAEMGHGRPLAQDLG